ncbi:MAG: Flp family type IVb pilin [Anaerolineae bacterium]
MLFLPREEGQGLVEYALILVLVAIVVIVVLSLLGPTIGNIFSNIVDNLNM